MTDGAPPDVTVVIASGRGARLAFALEALASEEGLARDDFEVVVVRDPRSPAPPPPPPGLDVRVLQAGRGANIALLRNLGWRAARGSRIVFTDDDCRPGRGWLAAMLAASDAAPGAIVQGRTEPDPDEAHLLHGLARSQRIVGPTPFLQTCNLLIPRDVLDREGGFDERFAALGEDTDLALRAVESGTATTYCDDALVWHAVLPRSLWAALREAARRDTVPALVARHPALREGLFWRLFWKRSHALALLALAGVLISRRRPLVGLALLALYANGIRDPREGGAKGLARRLLHLPIKAPVDAVEIAVTARTAARERTLVL